MAPSKLLFLFSLLAIATFSSTLAAQLLQSQVLLSRHSKLRQEKLSHLRFYWHDILSGRNPTSITITRGPATNSSTGFGIVNMIDNPLTLGPDMSSKLMGRAQGLYALASQETVGLMMAMNFVFTEGKYNGSTVTILGRNEVFNNVREMPVVGGSGRFRFARGYVHARTHNVDLKTRDACVRYDCYVMHY